MKILIPLILLVCVMASCAPSTKNSSNINLIDEAQQRRISELESQLQVQRHHNDRWQMITVSLGIGCVVLLMIGTALGAKTRHDAALS